MVNVNVCKSNFNEKFQINKDENHFNDTNSYTETLNNNISENSNNIDNDYFSYNNSNNEFKDSDYSENKDILSNKNVSSLKLNDNSNESMLIIKDKKLNDQVLKPLKQINKHHWKVLCDHKNEELNEYQLLENQINNEIYDISTEYQSKEDINVYNDKCNYINSINNSNNIENNNISNNTGSNTYYNNGNEYTNINNYDSSNNNSGNVNNTTNDTNNYVAKITNEQDTKNEINMDEKDDVASINENNRNLYYEPEQNNSLDFINNYNNNNINNEIYHNNNYSYENVKNNFNNYNKFKYNDANNNSKLIKHNNTNNNAEEFDRNKALEEEILKYKEANDRLEQLQNETISLNQRLIKEKNEFDEEKRNNILNVNYLREQIEKLKNEIEDLKNEKKIEVPLKNDNETN
ncbi:hypothetical protein H8356DRAFT_1719381, partial [Neocallimastix lanati (nom. inval.)]